MQLHIEADGTEYLEEGRPECGEKSLGAGTRCSNVQTESVFDSRRSRHMPATKWIKQYKLDIDKILFLTQPFLLRSCFSLSVSYILVLNVH